MLPGQGATKQTNNGQCIPYILHIYKYVLASIIVDKVDPFGFYQGTDDQNRELSPKSGSSSHPTSTAWLITKTVVHHSEQRANFNILDFHKSSACSLI